MSMADTEAGSPPGSPLPRWRARRMATALLAAIVVGAAVVIGHLFVWPRLPPMPGRADVIVQLGGPGDRRLVALNLVRAGRAPLVAISVSDAEAGTSWCALGRLHDVPVLCFHSQPFTTRGEARSVAALAAGHGWHSVILVTTRDQATRATLRLSRCYHGQIAVATAHLPWYLWPTQIVYQVGATVKAYTFETSC